MKDKIFEEMQIQVYTYRQRNEGKSPHLTISTDFYNEMLYYMNISEYRFLGCDISVVGGLKVNEFIIGEKFEVEVGE